MRITFIIFCCWIIAGCTKDFTIKLANSKPRYVIEGRVSNLEPPYLVRVTRSTTDVAFADRGSTLLDSAIGVIGAQVIISDGQGMVDTLQPASPQITGAYTRNPISGQDSIWTPMDPFVFSAERGYYSTTGFRGIPGHTYTLHVQIGAEAFQASAYLPKVTPLDSAGYKEAVVDPDGTKALTPFAWFNEPKSETNFYLLQAFMPEAFLTPRSLEPNRSDLSYNFYVFDDRTLPPYVDGLMCRVRYAGNRSGTTNFGYVIYPNTEMQVRLCSLTEDPYHYLDQVGKQFESDGNTYQPAPATPAGNISNGALGLFYATDISSYFIHPH